MDHSSTQPRPPGCSGTSVRPTTARQGRARRPSNVLAIEGAKYNIKSNAVAPDGPHQDDPRTFSARVEMLDPAR